MQCQGQSPHESAAEYFASLWNDASAVASPVVVVATLVAALLVEVVAVMSVEAAAVA